jgi:hypothetical protein
MKFTQEIKDEWIEALEYGKYTRCTSQLKKGDEGNAKHCCIGVLGEILPFLKNEEYFEMGDDDPYEFLVNTIGQEEMVRLYEANDEVEEGDDKGYSMVLPLIKKLKVQK